MLQIAEILPYQKIVFWLALQEMVLQRIRRQKRTAYTKAGSRLLT